MEQLYQQSIYHISGDNLIHQPHESQVTRPSQFNQTSNQFAPTQQSSSPSDHHQMISSSSYNREPINTPTRLNYNYEIHDDAWSSVHQSSSASSQVPDQLERLFKTDTPDYSINSSLEPLVAYQPDASQSCEHQQDAYNHQPTISNSIRVDASDFNNNSNNNNQQQQQTNLGAAQNQTQAQDCYRDQLFSGGPFYSHSGSSNLANYNQDADQQYNLNGYDDHNHSHNHNHNHHHHHHNPNQQQQQQQQQHHQPQTQQHSHQHNHHHANHQQQHHHHQQQQQQQQEHQNHLNQLAMLDELPEIDQSQNKLGNGYSTQHDASMSAHLHQYYEHEAPYPVLDNQLYQQQPPSVQVETAANQIDFKRSDDAAAQQQQQQQQQQSLLFEQTTSPDLYQAPRSTYTSLQQLTMNCDNYTNNQVSTTTAALSTSITSQHVAKTRSLKSRRGRPRKKGLRSKNKVNGKLWEFIRDLLLNEHTNPSFIRWERREDGVFKFVQSDKVAKMWGERKQNPKMTYEKLSRAMRYYYKSKVLLPVFGRRLVYKFGPNATGWLPDSDGAVY